MPKTRDTRKQHAIELLERLRRGPSLPKNQPGLPFGTRDTDAEYNVHLWLDTWIIPAVIALVPELKEFKK